MLQALAMVEEWRASFAPAANATAMWVKSVVARSDVEAIQIRSRYKRLPSLLRKIDRMQRTRVPQIEDVAGCRVVVPDLAHLRSLQQLLRASRVRNVEFPKELDDDYTDLPQGDGYRAVHMHILRTVRGQGPWRVEIQLRTARQHQWAEFVEEFDRVFGYDLKHGDAPHEVKLFFTIYSDVVRRRDMGLDDGSQQAVLQASFDEMMAWLTASERGA
ncbi:hypothetical protein [Cellulomonas sp. Y8]|uniref:hypothetical protein n=1 Tax=Cellulomonas sp. Y8 TaxID=2591145 RepID=UPI003D7082BF